MRVRNRSKKRPSAWELREGDLPSPEILEREPRLRGLENNPVFRLIVWRRRVAPLQQIVPGTPGARVAFLSLLFYLGLSVITQFYRPVWAVYPLTMLFILGFVILNTWPNLIKFSREARHYSTSLLHVPDIYIDGLLEAGYPLEEYAIGVWGAYLEQIFERKPPWNKWVFSTVKIGAILLSLVLTPHGTTRVILLMLVATSVISLFRIHPDPYVALLSALSGMCMERRDLARAFPNPNPLWGFFALFVILPFVLLPSLIRGTPAFPFLDQDGLVYWSEMLIAALLGFSFGMIERYVAFRDRKENLIYLKGIVSAVVLEIAAEREKHADSGRQSD